jgi:hypothetical protein
MDERKRFFPRPIWLRFHLYKILSKTRHPENRNFKDQKLQTDIFFQNEQKEFKTTAKNFINLSFAFPKLYKNQNLKKNSFSQTQQFSYAH